LISPWILASMVAMEERRRLILLIYMFLYSTCLWSMS
jgi:hypothetical protein